MMKFYPLVETAAGSGKFMLSSGAPVQTANTSAALALIAPTVGAGLRFGAWLNREVAGMPEFSPAPAAEVGKSYSVLIEMGGADQPFTLSQSVQVSMPFDASLLCLAMQQGANIRYGLMTLGQQPVPAKPETPAAVISAGSSSADTAATLSSGSVSSGGSATVTSGGLAG
ncbi:hypothetical protein ACI01nite_25020 [Acetobacter cibinongensis]|uniref:Uncharacterized protein n=1 Tax=Acetobacter cibinongensis TaxID=146475 RepID=A0A0D6N7D0_9PROT|nr:hypothetical protein [Acetobacter cibinongensis]GAN61605.1 hypothetical protein Abci_046_038 [Acetobacter cibinongensis]GBQ17613.1 hypothetical protein AA0482_1959 [Acetobacter cibinongensis NRIC 0482]GEL59900.1 hypothetical protein ACI01nite_25020 [Acetobacter cibinongensis]